MIPPEYMAILRRWYWLLAIFGLAGAILTYVFAVTTSFGQGSSYDASATLGVSRVLSYGGSVASASSSGADSDTTAAAALALTDWAKSPQFLSKVQADLASNGYVLPQLEVYNRVSVSSDRSPGVIVINSSAGDRDKAQQLVESAVYVLQDRAKTDEDKIRLGIISNLGRLSDDLGARLFQIYGELGQKTRTPGEPALRFAMAQFVLRGAAGSTIDEFAAIVRDLAAANNDPSMIVLLSQAGALEAELGEVSADRERLGADLKRWDEPLIVVSPAETVESQAVSRLRKRDLIVMGGLAGLVLGWAAANFADRMRPAEAGSRAVKPAASGRDQPEWEMTV